MSFAGGGREIAPFYVMEMVKAVEAAQADGRKILRLEVGQPSTGAPRAVVAAAQAALAGGDALGYTAATGIRPLRERLAAHYLDSYALAVDADRFVATVGSSVGFVLAFLAAFGPGARVAVTEPGYPCYRNTLTALGMVPVAIPLGPESGYRLTVTMLEQAGPLDGVIVASPANPTGTVMGRAALAEVAHWCHARRIRLISDEIYHGLTYGATVTTAAAVSSSALVVNSFSKYFSMTGWRLGWLVLPEDLVAAVERLAQNLVICPTTLAQHAPPVPFEGL